MHVLLFAGLIRAVDDRGSTLDPKEIERKAISKATFKVESTTVPTPQRIQIRKTMQRLGIPAKQGEELASLPRRTLKSEAEIDEWINDVQKQLIATLEKGPLGIQ